MVTNKTKNGRKFIKMYDPKTGEYLGPLINPMTHEDRVNYETTQRFYLPKFHFKRPE